MAKRLIILPTGIEAGHILTMLSAERTDSRLFSVAGKNTDILVCGAGMPASILNSSLHLQQNRYDLILLAGIAGSYRKDIQAGGVFNVKREQFADLGYFENGQLKSFFNLSDWTTDYQTGSIVNPNTELMAQCGLKSVTSNTVNICNIQLPGIPDADIENMEGAGLFMLFSKSGIPFLEIRAISNMVRDRDKTKWDIPLALENLGTELLRLLNI